MSAALPVLLNYSRPDGRSWRRWAWRIFLLIWAAFTIYLAYDVWLPWLRLQAVMLIEQGRCMNFVEAKDRVVFESDPARVAGMAGAVGYKLVFGLAVFSTTANQHWEALQSDAVALDDLESIRNPRRVGLFMGGPLFGGPNDEYPVFLHRLSIGENVRLVAIEASWHPVSALSTPDTAKLESVSLRAEIRISAGWSDTPKLPSSVNLDACEIKAPPGGHIRLLAGEPDPKDPSRFTIDFETSQGRGTIEGKLGVDDNVRMTIISGAALLPASAEPR